MLRTMLHLGRYLLVIPVIGALLLTVGVVIMSAGLIAERAWNLLQTWEFSLKSAKMMSYTVVQTIDFFLVGALGYITAVGIYNLFLSTNDEQLLQRIKIEKLKDLEDKIIGVVVAALAVAFLGQVSEATQMLDVLYAGIGIALMIAALCGFIAFTGSSDK